MLVCTEGKLEKLVIDELKQRFRNATIRVKVLGERGVACTVVKAAIKERTKLRRNGEKADEVWVVFDHDGDERGWTRAIRDARTQGLKLAVSNPCFELWGVLLHADHTSELHQKQVQQRLGQLHPGYRHEKPPRLPLNQNDDGDLDAAHERADRLNEAADQAGAPHRNPTTTFHHLVAQVRSL